MPTEWAYQSATRLLAAMAAGQLSSRDLLEYYRQRIERYNPQLNAVVATAFDAAFRRADEADNARREGVSCGPLHGLPITIKDTFEVQGMPCVAGAPALAGHRPDSNAFAVQRLLDAGAIIFGKTNVPLYAGDIQSYNKVYGSTNNPWDESRTPGGSSGGAAAALAAGFTALELGSDIGGSIRTPAHFCGVFGHKVTYGIVSSRGHIPGPPGMLSEPDLAVPGPLARSAEDLDLALQVVAAPGPLMSEYWSLNLPAPRAKQLQDFRVLLWLDDPLCPLDETLKPVYDGLYQQLQQAGAKVTNGAPEGVSLSRFFPVYMSLLGSVLGSGMKPGQRRMMRLMGGMAKRFGRWMKSGAYGDEFLLGMGQSHADWVKRSEERHRLTESFSKLFDQYDVVLTPVAMTAAFRHLQDVPIQVRKLDVNGGQRNYSDMFMWIAPATLMGLPATSAPVGQTAAGLPVGIQILGRRYDDRTTIEFARLLEQAGMDFRAPPGLS